MGKYSVPAEILAQKPKGTMVKAINGHYYVYEYSSFCSENGKRKTKTGKCIGSIKPEIGFVPNDNFNCDDEITTLEYGDYALVLANSQKVLQLLKECFNPADAVRIYCISMIHFIQGFVCLRDIKKYYEMSWLSIQYPGLKLGYDALSEVYENLGRRQIRVLDFEQKLLDNSSGEVAIDGHAIASQSDENDLAEKGYKFGHLNEKQMNLMMAYDIQTEKPLFARLYEGGLNDSVAIQDFFRQANFQGLLLIVDKGFYSYKNIELFSENNNSYLIPVPSRMDICKKANLESCEMERFTYEKNRKATVIEYSVKDYGAYRVYAFRDMNEFVIQDGNYLRYLEQGKKGYTKESYEQYRKWFGVYVLQTNLNDRSPKEIFELYKKRWSIETYFNYFKNKADYNSLYMQDYYKVQGLSFIMLVTSLIQHELAVRAKEIGKKSINECLLDARMVKINKRNGKWIAANCRSSVTKMFNDFNTELQPQVYT